MPAISADDLAALPRIAAARSARRHRPVTSVTTAPQGLEGEGFPVRRAFAGVELAKLDPFVHLDQMGEVNYAPGEAKGTPWHPHRGFETVTYMIDGVMEHADSTGGGGRISNGDTQWMTAGSGILHIEAPPEALVRTGGVFHGLQLWVNLPRAKKWLDARYQPIDGHAVTLLASEDGGSLVRVIAGAIETHRGPGSTHTPMNMMHATLQAGAQLIIPWPADYNALVYMLSGDAAVGVERRPVRRGQLAVLGGGDTLTVKASSTQDTPTSSADVLFLGGRPINEPIAWYGPFVMNTDDEIRQAFHDFRAGRLGTVPATTANHASVSKENK